MSEQMALKTILLQRFQPQFTQLTPPVTHSLTAENHKKSYKPRKEKTVGDFCVPSAQEKEKESYYILTDTCVLT